MQRVLGGTKEKRKAMRRVEKTIDGRGAKEAPVVEQVVSSTYGRKKRGTLHDFGADNYASRKADMELYDPRRKARGERGKHLA